jgi:hypothetical protein
MHGGKSRRGIAHPRFKHGRHSTTFPFSMNVALGPKCRRRHGTAAEHDRRERAQSAMVLRGYLLGRDHGYRDGFNAGQDAARKAAARPKRRPAKGG